MKWNDEQLKAINLVNQNIVVSASAGAGKTTILIARLIKRILNDGVSMNEVLAMTFTEAAASEMKKRLLQALNEAINKPDITQNQKEYLEKQLALALNAHISTIHSFCLSIIQNHYALINLSPRSINNIASESDVEYYQQKAFDTVINEYLINDAEAILNLVKYLGIPLGRLASLKNELLNIIRISNNQSDPTTWLTQQILKKVTNFNEFKDHELNYLTNKLKEQLDECISLLDNSINLVNEKYQETVANSLDLLSRAKININNHSECINLIIQAGSYTHTYRKPSSSEYNKAFKELISNLKETSDYVSEFNSTIPHINLLIDLSIKLMDKYHFYKTEDEKLDFNDLEHLAYKILITNDHEISRQYKNLFKEVMVDEFQDTNYVQNAIVELVANSNNTFRVGDIKQSIYRFRGAKPSLMQDLLQRDDVTKIYLKNNYRSKKSIVDFNNSLFSTLMNVDGLMVNYQDVDYQIADLPNQLLDNEDVRIHFIPPINEDDEDDETIELSPTSQKALYIAKSILNDIENTKYTNYSDYCILVENHQSKIDLKKALDSYNIPYYIDDKRGFIQSFSIRIIYSYLKLLTNYHDYISLTAVLTSPLYMMSEEDIYYMLPNIYDGLKSSNHSIINDLNVLKAMNNISDIINYIININNFYEEHINIQEKTNVDLFYSFALSDDTFTKKSFTDYIERILPKNKDSAIPISNEANVVKVMTIHQSKGLQFNVVYLFSKKQVKGPIASKIIALDEGLALPYRHPHYPLYTKTLNQLSLQYLDAKQQAEERLRILYVALTRAKECLNIVDCVDYDNEIKLNYKNIIKPLAFSPLIMAATNYFKDNYTYITSDTLNEIKALAKQTDIHYDIAHYPANIKAIEKIKPSSHLNTELSLNLSDIDFGVIGTMLHKTIELLTPISPINDDIIKEINPSLDQSYYHSLIELHNNDIYKATFKEKHIHEFEFTLKSEDELIHGFIDYIAFGDIITIIDFKSDRSVDEKELINRYYAQLTTYQKVIETIYPNSKVIAYIYSLSLHKMIAI